MGHYKGWTAAALIFGVSEVVLELLMPMLMSAIVDGGLYREDTFMLQGWFSPELIANRSRFVLTVGAIMVGVACLSMAMGVLAARCSAIATQGFARNMRGTLLGKIESFSFANIDHISTPQLITRATTDINTLRDTMRQSLVTLYRAPVMVILATVMSFIVSPRLAPLLLACIPLLAVVMTILLKVGQPRFKRMLKMMDGMNQAVRENLVASRVVKAYVRGGYESKRFDKTTDDLRQAQLGAGRLFTLSGTVKVDGRDVREYTLENLRSGVSMVLQNGSLFSGTIADNLRWADPNATLAQMQAACAIARADEYIDRFPDGYETVLEQNAANLSGGQRQRLLIARAILKKPRILILDDSTSAVDMATDEHIRRCLRTALPGATKIIIAQRINSIMSCDRIVVLDQGRLADMGTHQELLSRSPIYRDVYESQMREGAVDDAAC